VRAAVSGGRVMPCGASPAQQIAAVPASRNVAAACAIQWVMPLRRAFLERVFVERVFVERVFVEFTYATTTLSDSITLRA
jgi:hypothetical protein